jgi:hypothetical protein
MAKRMTKAELELLELGEAVDHLLTFRTLGKNTWPQNELLCVTKEAKLAVVTLQKLRKDK